MSPTRPQNKRNERRFCEEDRLLCEYGCWAFAVFAGEGDSHPGDDTFQEALVEAGGLEAMGSAVDAHRDSASLRRQARCSVTSHDIRSVGMVAVGRVGRVLGRKKVEWCYRVAWDLW